MDSLQSFVLQIETAVAGWTHSHGKKVKKVFPVLGGRGRDSIFVLGSIKEYPAGSAEGAIHCDGGPSIIFLAITLSGERWLEIECVDPITGDVDEVRRLHCRPGHDYLSSPACFWHRVRPVQCPQSKGPQRTLILRSNSLKWRISGGMLNESGCRSTGMVYGTGEAFVKMSAVVSDAIANLEHFQLDFV